MILVGLIFFIGLYILALSLISKQDRLSLKYSVKNYEYMRWLSTLNFQLFVPGIHLKYQIGTILLLIIYPFITLLDPLWREKYGFTGEFYEFPLVLERDRQYNYEHLKNVQSKYYWYKVFRKYDISTPKVYYYNDEIVNVIPPNENDKVFIKKPEYGGQGSAIEKVGINEYNSSTYNYNTLLQEYLEDCNSSTARGVRLYTLCENDRAEPYYLWYDTQNTDDFRTQSHHKTTRKFCDLNKCEDLSEEENTFIRDVSSKLCNLHETELNIIPILAWDIILTCDDAYVFEGNMCPTKTGSKNNELLNTFKQNLARQFIVV